MLHEMLHGMIHGMFHSMLHGMLHGIFHSMFHGMLLFRRNLRKIQRRISRQDGPTNLIPSPDFYICIAILKDTYISFHDIFIAKSIYGHILAIWPYSRMVNMDAFGERNKIFVEPTVLLYQGLLVYVLQFNAETSVTMRLLLQFITAITAVCPACSLQCSCGVAIRKLLHHY